MLRASFSSTPPKKNRSASELTKAEMEDIGFENGSLQTTFEPCLLFMYLRTWFTSSTK